MRVAVLCGGKGTRLGEPIKCLTEVAGRPWMSWKLDQLEALGATEIDLLCGPFRRQFEALYAGRAVCLDDAQTGIRDALQGSSGWWTMGDVLLSQPLEGEAVCFVVPGEQVGGLWLDCGLYHGPGPWRMVQARERPLTINTPADREETDATLRRHCLAR